MQLNFTFSNLPFFDVEHRIKVIVKVHSLLFKLFTMQEPVVKHMVYHVLP